MQTSADSRALNRCVCAVQLRRSSATTQRAPIGDKSPRTHTAIPKVEGSLRPKQTIHARRVAQRQRQVKARQRESRPALFTPEHTMKTRLEVVTKLVERLRDQSNDDERTDELDNALLHLEAANDRLIAMDEEEDEELKAPICDRYCPHCGETHIAIDDSECHHCQKPLYSY